MSLTFTDSMPPATVDLLSMFEQQSNLLLPRSYREFLQRNNGGKPSPKRFSTADNKVESMVAMFFHVGGTATDSLWDEFEGFTLAEQIPPNLLSIARDPADNRIVLSTAGKDSGYVYYWSWDEEPQPTTSRSYRYMRPIAPDFMGFLNSLR